MNKRIKEGGREGERKKRKEEEKGGREGGREFSGSDKGYFENKLSTPVAFKQFCTMEWLWNYFRWDGHGSPLQRDEN